MIVLAGGHGDRLRRITGQGIPKLGVQIAPDLRGIDFLQRELHALWPATYSANDYYYWFQKEGLKTVWQKGGGVAGDLIEKDHPIIILPNDCVLSLSFIPKMIESHKRGTLTWAITTQTHPLMASYNGCEIINGAIVGRRNLQTQRTPVMVIEPSVLKPFVQTGDDLYFDTMPRIEAENARRLQLGMPSILNAFNTQLPCFDYGTEERLEALRKELCAITCLQR